MLVEYATLWLLTLPLSPYNLYVLFTSHFQLIYSGLRPCLKAVVKFEHPRIPAFQPFMKPVSYFLRKQFHAVQCLYQL